MLSRRRLMLAAAGASLAPAALCIPQTAAQGAKTSGNVLVRQRDDALVAVDPFTGVTELMPSSTKVVNALAEEAPVRQCDAMPPRRIVQGEARYRQHWTDVDAHLVLAGRGASAAWWYWRDALSTRAVDLPLDLEPALETDMCARWYHGAQLDAAHLGSGSLRLMAFDLATGRIVLDRAFDRRLELAATSVSQDGGAIAHVQGGNTRLQLWMADLVRKLESSFELPVGPAPVAPAAIDLRVASRRQSAVLAAGISWAAEDHPDPFVVTVGLGSGEPVVTTVPGTLAVPPSNAART